MKHRSFIFGITCASVFWGYAMFKYVAPQHRGVDTLVYYHAALNDDEWEKRLPFYREDMPIGWLYKDWLRPLFRPLTWFSEGTAIKIMLGINIVCYLSLVWLVLGTRFGWVIVLATIKPAITSIGVGNIGPLLALAALSPITALLSGLVKPYALGFVVLLALREYMEKKPLAET